MTLETTTFAPHSVIMAPRPMGEPAHRPDDLQIRLDTIERALGDGDIFRAVVLADGDGAKSHVTSIVFEGIDRQGRRTTIAGAAPQNLAKRFHCPELIKFTTKSSPKDWQEALNRFTDGACALTNIPVTIHTKGTSKDQDRSTKRTERYFYRPGRSPYVRSISGDLDKLVDEWYTQHNQELQRAEEEKHILDLKLDQLVQSQIDEDLDVFEAEDAELDFPQNLAREIEEFEHIEPFTFEPEYMGVHPNTGDMLFDDGIIAGITKNVPQDIQRWEKRNLDPKGKMVNVYRRNSITGRKVKFGQKCAIRRDHKPNDEGPDPYGKGAKSIYEQKHKQPFHQQINPWECMPQQSRFLTRLEEVNMAEAHKKRMDAEVWEEVAREALKALRDGRYDEVHASGKNGKSGGQLDPDTQFDPGGSGFNYAVANGSRIGRPEPGRKINF